MGAFWETIGITLTQFLQGLSKVWEWLSAPLYLWGMPIMIGDWHVVPIQVFGIGFVVVLGVVFILHVKELII